MNTTAAVDHVLLLSAQQCCGESMVAAASRGASQEALDAAAEKFCERVVQTAVGPGTSAEHTLSVAIPYLEKLAAMGLSQKTKDSMLATHLAASVLGDSRLRVAFHIAHLGTSPRATRELRKTLIRDGYVRLIKETVALEGVALTVEEIDTLTRVCVTKHMRYNPHYVAQAAELGASYEVREHAAREFIREHAPRRVNGKWTTKYWESFLTIVGDGWCSSELLDRALAMVIEDTQQAIRDARNHAGINYSDVNRYISFGVLIAKRGASTHVVDFFVQELVTFGEWTRPHVVAAAARCSPPLVESLTANMLQKVQGRLQNRDSTPYMPDIIADLKKLAQLAQRATIDTRKAVLNELIAHQIIDEAIELAASMEA